MLTFQAETLTLTLRTPFKVAHGASVTRENVIVHLNGALGEAALPPYYDANAAQAIAYLERPEIGTLLAGDLMHREDILNALPPGPKAAQAALDIALHDLAGRQLGVPLYRLWGLNPARMPLSSFTIGIEEDEAAFRERVRAAAQYPILKLKLGSGSLDADEGMVCMAHEETDARICVDANAGWSVAEAARIIPRLAAYDLVFIEQPIARDDIAGWRHLRAMLAATGTPPLIADESVHTTRDILPLVGAADGINIKLAKAGGLREAWRMVHLARASGMRILIGCMVESAVGVTAAAHLAPLADYADLDGNLLVREDPFQGVAMGRDGTLRLPEGPGLGVVQR